MPRPRSARRLLSSSHEGSVLLTTVLVIGMIGAVSVMIFLFQVLTLRMMQARNATSQNSFAAEGAARVMSERLIATAQARLGEVTTDDLDSLETTLSAIPLPDGVTLDLDASGYEMTASVSGRDVSTGEPVAQATTDWPRFAQRVAPDPGGLEAADTRVIWVTATVTSAGGGRRTVTRQLAISHLPPYQFAVETRGDLEVCATESDNIYVSGRIRAHGSFEVPCANNTSYGGDLYVRDSLAISSSGLHRLFWDGGRKKLASVGGRQFEGDVQGWLLNWNGRVRVGRGMGDRLTHTPFQTFEMAGHGECPDFDGACGGRAIYTPSATLQRTTSGPTSSYDVTCGVAYQKQGVDCASTVIRPAVSYTPFPFTSDTADGVARMHPSYPDSLVWHGLFPDHRREDYCTAAFENGTTWRTLRCPTNPYGYTVDLSQLDPVEGGVLSFRAASTTSSLNNESGFQEVVLLRNARTLSDALTIHSELPVFIAGSFNNLSRVPAMIDAPLITVLPNETASQAAQAALWDSVSSTTHANLKAHSDVTLYGVFRSNYHPTGGGGYYGGTLEHIPAVLGDFSNVSLTVVGAIEGRAVAPATPGSYASAYPPHGAEPSGWPTLQPNARRIRWDPRLADPSFRPPGSYSAANTPAGGAGGSRTEARQSHAYGGMMVVRWLRHELRAPGAVRE